jgi:hypothetical protein
MPLVVNLFDGHLYVVGLAFTALEHRQYGFPQPPYVCYSWGATGWSMINFSDLPTELYETNMYLLSRPPSPFGAKLTTQDQQEARQTWPVPQMKRLDKNYRY